ncbi:MAG: hypothetical protein JWN95_1081, partial [Frankiales bacterium]|nr:hypothetical protein [Frankiales bacterium]
AGALKEAQAAGKIAIVEVISDADALPAVPHGGRDFYAPAPKA